MRLGRNDFYNVCGLDSSPPDSNRESSELKPPALPTPDSIEIRKRTEHELRLPLVRRLRRRKYKASYYGAMSVLAEYCNVRFYRQDPPICWAHGAAIASEAKLDAHQILQDELEKKHSLLLVRSESEVQRLREFGIETQAIGLPIVYTTPPEVERIPKSLLIMPMHSLDYTKHSWNFDEYAAQVSCLKASYDLVVACVHPSCWRNGYWVDALSTQGIACIRGADSHDRNALRRMARLFSQFEVVTTNGWGSHLPYAAHFGAKIAIYGKYAELKREDYANCRFYDDRGDQLDSVLKYSSEKFVSSQLPWLFNHPRRARQASSWGRQFVGWQYKKSPEEITLMMGWGRMRSLSRFVAGARRSH